MTVSLAASDECQVVGTTADGGSIVSCIGTVTDGLVTGAHGDEVVVETGASISSTYYQQFESVGVGGITTIFSAGGDDWLTNNGTVGSSATLSIAGVADIYDGTLKYTNSLYAEILATGIDSGTCRGRDTIVNNGTIGEISATADISAGQINLDLVDMADADIRLTARATAIGIRGATSNSITNTGIITVKSVASILDWTSLPDINVADNGTVTATDSPHAMAIGVQGGTGYDAITNTGTITSMATAYTAIPHVEVNAVDLAVAGAGIGTADDPMSAAATGIDAGSGASEIINAATGKVTADGYASANIENIVLTLYDATIKADSVGHAGSIATHINSSAVGIKVGDGNAGIANHGEISATARTKVISVGLGVGAEGVPSGLYSPGKAFFEQPVFTLATADIAAASEATGIQGAGGNDSIVNTGKITVYAGPLDDGITPTILATGASISFPLLEVTGFSKWAGGWNNFVDFPPAIAIASTGISAHALATGIDGGDGNDSITNSNAATAPIDVTAKASATNFQASISAQNVTSEGGTGWSMNLDLALAKATTEAYAHATGLAGGSGNDTIDNRGFVNVTADANAFGSGVSLVLELLKGMDREKGWGLGLGAALTNLSTTAEAESVGISGGTGDDTINNSGQLNVDADAAATSIQASITVQGEVKGLGGGVALANTSSTATATSTGIAGGAGADHVSNWSGGNGLGTLHAYADADVSTNTFAVTVESTAKGVDIGGALAKASAEAKATATGIDGGEGNDILSNEAAGNIDVNADALVNNLSATVDVQAGVKGVGIGVAMIDSTSLTTADAQGILGGAGNDQVVTGVLSSLKSYAVSSAYAESFSVSVQGESTGLVLGGSLVIASTTANGTAIGIDGQAGNDEIRNQGTVDANTTSTTNNLAVAVDVQGTVNGVGAGFAFTDATANATATTTGMAGGTGNDWFANGANATLKAYADANAYADLLTVNVQGSSTGIVVGGAVALAESRATSSAIGMDGGEGRNTLVNDAYGLVDVNAESTANSLAFTVAVQGVVEGFGGQAGISDTSTFATASSTGLAGGSEQDTIGNGTRAQLNSHATANAYAESITVTVQGNATGVTLSGSLARAETTPTAAASGIVGGAGGDTLGNDGFMDVKATTDSTSVAVGARVNGVIEGISVGASLTDTSTTATAIATGIDGGADNDTIANYRTIQAATDSTLRATSVSVDFGGVPIGITVGAALSRAATNGTGTATGVDGGSGNDAITNSTAGFIDVDATAVSTSTAVSISANVIGAAWTDTSATTTTRALGMAGGEGHDGLANLGLIDVDSNSTANVSNVSFNLAGVTPVSGWTTASAVAIGIDGASGNDSLDNRKDITADSTATTNAFALPLQVIGYSDTDISTNAIASATGVAGGAGLDTLTNAAAGSITATATANAHATAVSINLLGYSTVDGRSTGSATAKGMDGGDGYNTITNLGGIVGTATVTADASSYDIQLAGGAEASAGTEATASATGIAGGKDIDILANQGTISLTTTTTLTAQSRSYKLAGVGLADAESEALAFAAGIDGAEGSNTISNDATGSIHVSASASANAGSITGVAIGVAGAKANTTSRAHARGIASGAGLDAIVNRGILDVKVASSTAAGNGAFGLFGLGIGAALTTAAADGIDAGGGDDFVRNTGAITVGNVQDNDHPMAYSNVESVTLNIGSFSSAELGATAEANGILGGAGDDTIRNEGTVTVGSDYWMSKARALGVTGSFLGILSVGAKAETKASGLAGGDGTNTVINDVTGVLTVRATSHAYPTGKAETVFGMNAGTSEAKSFSTAAGVTGGKDRDVVENWGAIDVVARAWSDSYSDSYVFWGNPNADSTARATATAYGISPGAGSGMVTNRGLLTVGALAETSPYALADSEVDETDADAAAYSNSTAIGILAGDDGSVVANVRTGRIAVTATANSFDALNNPARATSDEKADVSAMLTGSASGIRSGSGNDWVRNDGEMAVTAIVNSSTHAMASSAAATATATSTSGGRAAAVGIDVGDGFNLIEITSNLSVAATITGTALSDYPSAHLDNAVATATNLTAGATGILAGAGSNGIENRGTIAVTAVVDADALAYSNTWTTDTTSWAYAGGSAVATGIAVGGGFNVIGNRGTIKVAATGDAYALGSAEEYGYAYVGSAAAPGITAEAVGISAAGGRAVIANHGVLDISAAATGTVGVTGDDATDSFASAAATAIGIKTGEGDDWVGNYGTILTTQTAHGPAAAGMAITTGAGNDTVVLGAGSTTKGDVDLGAGDDTLVLQGTSTLNGISRGGVGSNTLVFDGAGTLAYNFAEFESTIKQGQGRFVISELPTMQQLKVRQGVLQVDRDYQFAPGGTFQATINGNGSFGQLAVNGNAQLGGALSVLKGPGVFRNGTTYAIIETTGGAVGGSFAGVALPKSRPLLSFQLEQGTDQVEVRVVAPKVCTAATNKLEYAMAAYFDRIMPTATGDLSTALGEFQALDGSQLGPAFRAMSTESHASLARVGLAGIGQFLGDVRQRMGNLRPNIMSAGTGSTMPVMLGSSGFAAGLGGFLATDQLARRQARDGFWINGYGQWGDHRALPGYSPYDYRSYGSTIGLDHKRSDDLLIGASLGMSRAEVEFGGSSRDSAVNGVTGALYGSYFMGNAYIEAAFSYGRQSYRNHRAIDLGSEVREASGQHVGTAYTAYLGGGYDYAVDGLTVTPFANMRYINLAEKGFTESGAGSLNLTVGRRKTDSLVAELGARAARVLTMGNGTLVVDLSAALNYDFDIDDQVVTASFAEAPGNSFSISGEAVEKYGVTIGAGMTLLQGRKSAAVLRYIGEFRERNASHGLMGEFRYAF
ncbi:MAG: autotransporter domain-containing protein [Rhodocyclales bacterium]|nr:autotransporter domain-containing protein [Rhodocyclales bacterium]